MSTARVLGKRRSAPPAQLKSSELRSAGVKTAPRETPTINPKAHPDDDDKKSASQEVFAADASKAKDMRQAPPAPVPGTSFHCGACGMLDMIAIQPPNRIIWLDLRLDMRVAGVSFRSAQGLAGHRQNSSLHRLKLKQVQATPKPAATTNFQATIQAALSPLPSRDTKKPVKMNMSSRNLSDAQKWVLVQRRDRLDRTGFAIDIFFRRVSRPDRSCRFQMPPFLSLPFLSCAPASRFNCCRRRCRRCCCNAAVLLLYCCCICFC